MSSPTADLIDHLCASPGTTAAALCAAAVQLGVKLRSDDNPFVVQTAAEKMRHEYEELKAQNEKLREQLLRSQHQKERYHRRVKWLCRQLSKALLLP